MNRTLILAFLSLAACGGDKLLEGPLKTCSMFVTYPAGQCTLCGDTEYNSTPVNTANYTVTKKEARKAKRGAFLNYSEYDEPAADICRLFMSDDTSELEETISSSLKEGNGCRDLGYTEKVWVVFSDGTEDEWLSDGSCQLPEPTATDER